MYVHVNPLFAFLWDGEGSYSERHTASLSASSAGLVCADSCCSGEVWRGLLLNTAGQQRVSGMSKGLQHASGLLQQRHICKH